MDLNRPFNETQIILFACSMEFDRLCALDFTLDLFLNLFNNLWSVLVGFFELQHEDHIVPDLFSCFV